VLLDQLNRFRARNRMRDTSSFTADAHPTEMGSAVITTFLTSLADRQQVSASTQKQPTGCNGRRLTSGSV